MADRSGGGEGLLDGAAFSREGHRCAAAVGGFEETGLTVGEPNARDGAGQEAGESGGQHLLNSGGGASSEDVLGETLDGGDTFTKAGEAAVAPPPDERGGAHREDGGDERGDLEEFIHGG
jgi:hypothetical protein